MYELRDVPYVLPTYSFLSILSQTNIMFVFNVDRYPYVQCALATNYGKLSKCSKEQWEQTTNFTSSKNAEFKHEINSRSFSENQKYEQKCTYREYVESFCARFFLSTHSLTNKSH